MSASMLPARKTVYAFIYCKRYDVGGDQEILKTANGIDQQQHPQPHVPQRLPHRHGFGLAVGSGVPTRLVSTVDIGRRAAGCDLRSALSEAGAGWLKYRAR